MARVIDLTMPIADHFRWPVARELKQQFARGDPFQVTWLGWAVHSFTHIDAPRHILPDGPTTSDLALEWVVGAAAVLDLTGVAPNTALSEEHLRRAGAHLRAGEIALLKTCWESLASPATPEFWTTAPYLTRAACAWLLVAGVTAVGFDFPQDYPIRGLLSGHTAPIAEFVSHDILLRAGIPLIEYLCNLGALTRPRVEIYALPLKIPDADGAPARVIAVERE